MVEKALTLLQNLTHEVEGREGGGGGGGEQIFTTSQLEVLLSYLEKLLCKGCPYWASF